MRITIVRQIDLPEWCKKMTLSEIPSSAIKDNVLFDSDVVILINTKKFRVIKDWTGRPATVGALSVIGVYLGNHCAELF